MTHLLITLDHMIENASEQGRPSSIVIGYKAFHSLMKDRRFSEEVNSSALSPEHRRYRKIRLQLTTDDYQLKVI